MHTGFWLEKLKEKEKTLHVVGRIMCIKMGCVSVDLYGI
jgi:hypothetical protein